MPEKSQHRLKIRGRCHAPMSYWSVSWRLFSIEARTANVTVLFRTTQTVTQRRDGNAATARPDAPRRRLRPNSYLEVTMSREHCRPLDGDVPRCSEQDIL